MRISDWSSDVCSSDLIGNDGARFQRRANMRGHRGIGAERHAEHDEIGILHRLGGIAINSVGQAKLGRLPAMRLTGIGGGDPACQAVRSEEHTSELQSLMRNSYAVFCLKKKTNKSNTHNTKR